MISKQISQKLTALAIIWLIFTLSLVGWWWYHALTSFTDERVQRMFLWEGAFLFFVLFLGGSGLVFLAYNYQNRHDQLKMFFATFAHDLKTSISRLRLQGELLEESSIGKEAKLQSILRDIQRLDLQLENSLWMAQLDSNKLLLQETKLSEVMDHLRNEFSEIRFELSKDAKLIVDRRAFTVILRNLFNNATLHGEADRIEMNVSNVSSSEVSITMSDNGIGLKIPVDKLGSQIMTLGHKHSNGLGLYLCRKLIERMHGHLQFVADPKFKVVLKLKGQPA